MSYSELDLRHLVKKEAHRVLGEGVIQLTRLSGDASNRIYHRCSIKGASLIVMELGANPLASEEAIGGASPPQELPFIDVHRYLASGGVPVPEVYAYLKEEGLVLLEDLGDQTMESLVAGAGIPEQKELYKQALSELIRLQQFAKSRQAGCISFSRSFDFTLLRWELDHFREWLLEADRQCFLDGPERETMTTSFDSIAEELSRLPQVWVHRDFQSRNIMVQKTQGKCQLRLIDFQDALMGPPPYDIVALLRDSYVNLGLPLTTELLEFYLENADIPLSKEEFRRAFWLQTVQRKLKDAGRFVFIDRIKHNPNFLSYIPTSLTYVRHALTCLPDHHCLAELLARHIDELRH